MTANNKQNIDNQNLNITGEMHFSVLLLFNTLQSNSLPTVQILRIRLKQ